MRKLLFFLLFLPLWAGAQGFDDFEYWGVRAAFTHTNRSHNLGFVGASLNTEYNWVSRSLYAGVHLGAQNTLTEDGRKQSKMQIVPEIGYEFSLVIFRNGVVAQYPCTSATYRSFFFQYSSGLCGVFASFPSRYRFQGTDLYTCA